MMYYLHFKIWVIGFCEKSCSDALEFPVDIEDNLGLKFKGFLGESVL